EFGLSCILYLISALSIAIACANTAGLFRKSAITALSDLRLSIRLLSVCCHCPKRYCKNRHSSHGVCNALNINCQSCQPNTCNGGSLALISELKPSLNSLPLNSCCRRSFVF